MHALLIIMVVITAVDTVVERVLARLNNQSANAVDAQAVSDVYTPEQVQNSIAYSNAQYKFGTIKSIYTWIVTTGFLTLGGFGWVDDLLRARFDNTIVIAILFVVVLSLASAVASLPFSIYGTFVLEARFGFNRTTPQTFITDLIKGGLVGGIVISILMSVLTFIYESTGSQFWIIGWVALTAFSIFMFMFGTSLLLPLFNKATPLPEGELRDALSAYCESQGYKVNRLFVIDASKRSTKANAFFAGLGPMKTIVLFDTLIEKLTTEEIVAVLAHEVGHAKLRHTRDGLILNLVQTFVMFFILGIALSSDALSEALGAAQPSFHVGLIAFMILYSPLSFVSSFVTNSISRRNEYSADEFSLKTFKPETLASALTKISSDALSNLNPHPWYVAAYYTHPTLKQRRAKLLPA